MSDSETSSLNSVAHESDLDTRKVFNELVIHTFKNKGKYCIFLFLPCDTHLTFFLGGKVAGKERILWDICDNPN